METVVRYLYLQGRSAIAIGDPVCGIYRHRASDLRRLDVKRRMLEEGDGDGCSRAAREGFDLGLYARIPIQY
jgi:hypothetical protein